MIKRGDKVQVGGAEGIATHDQYTARNGREYVLVRLTGAVSHAERKYLAANVTVK
jgi:hypothetical protein